MMHTGFELSQAELAVLTQALLGDDLDLNQTAQADLGVGEAQLRAARAALRRRGWLSVDGSDVVDEELAAVLATTILPDRLAIVKTSLPDGEQPARHYSWAAGRIVHNTINARGAHEFSVLDGLATAIDEIAAVGRLPRESAGVAGEASAPLESLVASMQALTMLLVVEQPAQPEPTVRNLSWLTANGSLWLVDAEQAGRQRARSVDRAALRQAIVAAIGPE